MKRAVEWYRWTGDGGRRPDIEFSVETFEDGGAIMRTKTIEGMQAPRVTVAPDLAGMVEVRATGKVIHSEDVPIQLICTSDQWNQDDERAGRALEILDPDGWDRSAAGWHYSWYEERITRHEYETSTLPTQATGRLAC
jgi:hypothetical protein